MLHFQHLRENRRFSILGDLDFYVRIKSILAVKLLSLTQLRFSVLFGLLSIETLQKINRMKVSEHTYCTFRRRQKSNYPHKSELFSTI